MVKPTSVLIPHYRKADQKDIKDPSRGGSDLLSRFLTSFLVLGCGVFGIVYLFRRSFLLAGVVSGTVFALSAYSIRSHHRDIKKRERRMNEPQAIEVIEVKPLRVAEIEAHGSTGPALCFELQNGHILLLYGQWLLEHDLYRAPKPVGDGNQERFNLCSDPHSFPSDHFVLHRWAERQGRFGSKCVGSI